MTISKGWVLRVAPSGIVTLVSGPDVVGGIGSSVDLVSSVMVVGLSSPLIVGLPGRRSFGGSPMNGRAAGAAESSPGSNRQPAENAASARNRATRRNPMGMATSSAKWGLGL